MSKLSMMSKLRKFLENFYQISSLIRAGLSSSSTFYWWHEWISRFWTSTERSSFYQLDDWEVKEAVKSLKQIDFRKNNSKRIEGRKKINFLIPSESWANWKVALSGFWFVCFFFVLRDFFFLFLFFLVWWRNKLLILLLSSFSCGQNHSGRKTFIHKLFRKVRGCFLFSFFL